MLIDVYKNDFKKDVEGFGQPQSVIVPAMPCTIRIDISGKVDDADFGLIRDRLMESMEKSQVREKLNVQLYKLTKQTDELIAGLAIAEPDKIPAAIKQYGSSAEAAIAQFEGDVGKAFVAAWNKLIEDRQKYKTYKIKAVLDFTVNAVSLAGSIASLATAATPAAPLTAVLGIYGIAKSLTKLCVQCRNLYIEAETVAKDVESDVVKLKKKYDDLQKSVEKGTDKAAAEAAKAKREVKLKELAVATGNKLFGDIVSVFVTSVEGATKKNSLYGNKIRGIQDGTTAVAREYLAMTDHMQALYTYVRALDDEYKVFVARAGYSPVARPYLNRRQKRIQTAFQAWNGATKAFKELNAEVAASEKRQQTNLAKQKEFQKAIDEAEAAFKTKNWAVAGRWLGVAIDVGLAVGPSGAAAWASAEKIVTTTMKLVVIAEKECITEIKDRLMK